jgi:hypothetical protein
MSPCDHMTLFVAKSSPEWTRVLRRVIGCLTVRRLVNINPGRPISSSTAAPRKPQHHRLWSLRSESKSFFFLKHAHGIIKRAIQEAGGRRRMTTKAAAVGSSRRGRRWRSRSPRRCRCPCPTSPRRCRRSRPMSPRRYRRPRPMSPRRSRHPRPTSPPPPPDEPEEVSLPLA